MKTTTFKPESIHRQQVRVLQSQLKEKKEYFCLKKEQCSNTLRSGDYKRKWASLDFKDFDSILEFNSHEKWIVVEPRITFFQLCKFTLKHGLIPPVVPEFKTITIGGAIMGAALESSSHKFGQVSDTCLSYELLLGDGEQITASPTENSDLFYAVSGSYGTLALLTAVKIQLIPAKRWVHLSLLHIDDAKKAAQALTCEHSENFIEGIVFNPNHAVVIKGNMVEKPGHSLFRQKGFWSKWYVQHLIETKKTEAWMPLEDYLFRHDRGAFWIGRYVHSFWVIMQLLLHLGVPHIKKKSLSPGPLFRWLFGWAFSSKRLYKLWHRVPAHISEKLFFIHDFYAPFSKADAVLERFMEQASIFPIWLCPIKGTQTPQFLSPHFGGENFLNIGLYGIPARSGISIPNLSAQLENEIITYGGKKMLYSFIYYDQTTFSNIYSEATYANLRKKYKADGAFPTIYNKLTNNFDF